MASVLLDKVWKTYPNGHVAARGVELAIEDGEFMVLVGPSGCGKSTALRMIAGLETPTQGRVLIGDRDVTEVPPQERDIAMVFQSYALYPHMTVRDNLGFGLRMRGTSPAGIAERVEVAAKALGLEKVLDRKPGQLSGGQRQRVALGRAIVREPMVFLFDEPLSNLDAKLRLETRAELARLHRRLAATMVYVTHDQEEALTLGTRVAVMSEGRVEQVGPPLEVYRRPETMFVATFVGSPAMNLLPAETAARPGQPGRQRRDARGPAARCDRRARRRRRERRRWWTWSSPGAASCCSISGSAPAERGPRSGSSPRRIWTWRRIEVVGLKSRPRAAAFLRSGRAGGGSVRNVRHG